jgi:Ni/Fe-hydrogenase subunit HybB-like protein
MAEITYFTCCNMLQLIKLDFYNLLLLLLYIYIYFKKNIKYLGEKRKKNRKKSKKHIKTLIMTPLIYLKRTRQDKYHDTKKCHQQ